MVVWFVLFSFASGWDVWNETRFSIPKSRVAARAVGRTFQLSFSLRFCLPMLLLDLQFRSFDF